MIKRYVEWIKEYWKKFFSPQGLAIYVTSIIVSSVVGKAIVAFFSKKTNEQIEKLKEKNDGSSRDYNSEAIIEANYYQAQSITGTVVGIIISTITMILIAKLPKKGEN